MAVVLDEHENFPIYSIDILIFSFSDHLGCEFEILSLRKIITFCFLLSFSLAGELHSRLCVN